MTDIPKDAKMEHEGKFYCGIHDPVRIKDKRKAQADKWRAEADALRASRAEAEAKQAALEQDAARYRKMQSAMYDGDVDIGEAYVRMKVVGSCPSIEQFDAAIDAMKA